MPHNKDGEQKSLKQFGLFSLVLITAFSTLYAEDFADFKRVQNAAFGAYKNKNDKRFESYLKTEWQAYQSFTTPALYKKAKPKQIPRAEKESVAPLGPNIHLILLHKKELHATPMILQANATHVNYFGTMLSFTLDRKIKEAHFYPQNREGILNSFSIFAASDYEGLVQEIKDVSKKMQLNGWGVYLLVTKIAAKSFYETDEQRLFSWFLLNKLGYDTRIGIQNAHTVLLSATTESVYAAPRYTIHNKFYYNLAPHSGKGALYTYEKSYPNAVKSLDFSLATLPVLANDEGYKKRNFSFLQKHYTIAYHYNKNLIAFMKTYPQVAYKVFFDAPLEAKTYSDILASVRPYLEGKKMNFGINFLLRFVQTAFKYERDREQFAKEKVMFAQETLVYDKSDCEDRATLYARLVKDFFGIRVIGVKYANHMATALYIPLHGASVKYNAKRYVIADPTYINANVGESMPRYRSIIPEKFISLN